jgi:cytochrome c oxidase assembly protein subunit 11
MIEFKRNLTPVVLVGIFCLMLGLSYAAVPLYELFCRVTGFGGTVRIADKQELPNIVINQDYQVRFDTNTHSGLDWDFKVEKNILVLKPGEIHNVKFYVKNNSATETSGAASFNASPNTFGTYLTKIGCFCFEKQTLQPNETKEFVMSFFLDPKVVDDNKTKDIYDVTLSYTFFSSDYYKGEKI